MSEPSKLNVYKSEAVGGKEVFEVILCDNGLEQYTKSKRDPILAEMDSTKIFYDPAIFLQLIITF